MPRSAIHRPRRRNDETLAAVAIAAVAALRPRCRRRPSRTRTSRSASSCRYAAGGTSDILARQIGPKLTEAWGQPVIVENKPGANGNVGAEFVAKIARPTATRCCSPTSAALVISASVYPKLPFDPAKDFSPVVMVSYSPHVLAVHPSVPVKNVKELVADGEGASRASSTSPISGIGGAPHLAGIEFAAAHRRATGPTSPTRAARTRSPTWSRGQAHVLFNGMLATWPSVTGGRLQGARRSRARSAFLRRPTRPRSPSRACPASRPAPSRACVGAAGTPRDIVAKLNAELTRHPEHRRT